jgi:glyoxylase-like metal-dependent hydrolase (beta-lactamase superfamily II)
VKRVIKGVHVVPMGFTNAFLIEGDDGLTLIDAGYASKETAVFEAIRTLGRSPDQLKHLIFTHAHPDHVGSAAAIVRRTGARTYMHPLDIPIAESGGPFRPMTPAPGLLGRVLCRLFFHPDERLDPVAIDQPLTPGKILLIAGGFEVIHVPGHCAGQVALLWRPGRMLFAGDVCTNIMASVIPLASRTWRKAVRASANLPVFHSMLPDSAMESLSPATRRRAFVISMANIQRTCINSDPWPNARCRIRLVDCF